MITYNKKNIFWYIVLSIIVLYIFSKLNLGINILIGLIVIFLLIYYNEQLLKESEEKQAETDDIINKSIYPQTIPIISKKYKEINEFLFFIQDFQTYNPPSYENMIDVINEFFTIYDMFDNITDNTTNNTELTDKNPNMPNDLLILKKEALNSLHSIIFKIPSNKNIENKLSNAIEQLDILLSKYIINIKNIYTNSPYNINKKLLDDNIEPKNLYDNDMFEKPLRKQIFSYSIY
jgi:hypothetical protein